MQAKLRFLGSLILFTLLFSPLPAIAQSREPISPERVAFGNAIQALSYDEVDQILLEIQAYQLDNPGVSEEDLNRLASTLVGEQVRKPFREGSQQKSGYLLPQAVYNLNSLERGLCILSPLKCLKVYSCSNKAQSTAPTYFDGCTNGRCDAFRHTYWNALMVRRIDYNFARDFAAAHEVGNQANIGTLPMQMDVFNNSWGQYIGQNYTTAKYTETDVERVVKSYVLTGKLAIIKNNRIVRSNQ